MKNSKEGKTAQNILVDKLTIFWISFVSEYSQIIAIMEVRGRETNIAAIGENLLPSSDTENIIRTVMIILIIYCIY